MARAQSPNNGKPRRRKTFGKKGNWSEFVQTGPGTPLGALLRRYWQPVLVSRELPVGKARPIRIMGEDLTVYRGESGKPYIVARLCPHRLTLLYDWGHMIRVRPEY